MEQVKHWLDLASLSTILATLMGWLPHVAAALSIVWTGIRIYETDTVQKLLKRLK
jgi:hypothetical protein